MIFDEHYIEQRINRSKESIEEAKLLFENGHSLTVFNRLYYAVFYLACAYLAKAQIETNTHSGTKTQFNAAFIKTGLVDVSFGKLYSKLFNDRNEADYADFFNPTKQELEKLIQETEEQLLKYWKEIET